MTREEAIEILEETGFIAHSMTDVDTALDMAIEALEHEQERREDIYECPNCIGEVHKNYIYCPFCGIKMESDEQ